MKNKGIGAKTRSLMKLNKAGFRVPRFIAFSTQDIHKNDFISLAQKARKALKVRKYAVRSSALIEDGQQRSYAGQFMSKVNQDYDVLPAAIEEVVQHGQYFLNGDLKKFSIIVQEYVEAEYSGVLFTRNPMGGREMVVETFKGIGEKLVGGEVKPKKYAFYWNEEVPPTIPGGKELIKAAKEIEAKLGGPQDIEWCYKGGKIYFLQSRPITTLPAQDYLEMQYLEKVLPEGEYCFEKTELSEIAERPCTFTLSLLQELYKKGGPVEAVYQKHGVEYRAKDFLKVFGNELYVDRKLEEKTLMDGWWMSFKNAWRINRMSLLDYQDLKQNVEIRLHAKLDQKLKFADRLKIFLDDYQLIFEVNLLAAKAVKRLENVIKGQPVEVAEILACNFETEYEDVIHFNVQGLKGNSLDIADQSPFAHSTKSPEIPKSVDNWYDSLNDFKKKMYLPLCLQAQKFNRLRENSRWLTVRYINYLRLGLPKKANIYFATVSEIIKGKSDARTMKKRKAEFDSFAEFNLPVKLSSKMLNEDNELLGVSAGEAEGVLMNIKNLKKGGILYVKILAPDLTKQFKKASAIVSEKGGMLSHLAIMARESGIPVITGLDLEKSAFQLGDHVAVDGTKGQIFLKTEPDQA